MKGLFGSAPKHVGLGLVFGVGEQLLSLRVKACGTLDGVFDE